MAIIIPKHNEIFLKNNFVNFFSKNGFLLKYQNVVCRIFQNLSFFFLTRSSFIFENYPNLTFFINNMIEKKINYTHIFKKTVDLIKPPFVIKSITVPKKIKKKIKQKFLLKVVYRNEDKRIKNSFKQIQHYANTFNNNSVSIRLYKSILLTFLEWNESHHFKLKSVIFKKFFKF